MLLRIYRRADGKWAWNLRATNGRIVATDGGQGYNNETDCTEAAKEIVTGRYTNARVEHPHPTNN